MDKRIGFVDEWENRVFAARRDGDFVVIFK